MQHFTIFNISAEKVTNKGKEELRKILAFMKVQENIKPFMNNTDKIVK